MNGFFSNLITTRKPDRLTLLETLSRSILIVYGEENLLDRAYMPDEAIPQLEEDDKNKRSSEFERLQGKPVKLSYQTIAVRKFFNPLKFVEFLLVLLRDVSDWVMQWGTGTLAQVNRNLKGKEQANVATFDHNAKKQVEKDDERRSCWMWRYLLPYAWRSTDDSFERICGWWEALKWLSIQFCNGLYYMFEPFFPTYEEMPEDMVISQDAVTCRSIYGLDYSIFRGLLRLIPRIAFGLPLAIFQCLSSPINHLWRPLRSLMSRHPVIFSLVSLVGLMSGGMMAAILFLPRTDFTVHLLNIFFIKPIADGAYIATQFLSHHLASFLSLHFVSAAIPFISAEIATTVVTAAFIGAAVILPILLVAKLVAGLHEIADTIGFYQRVDAKDHSDSVFITQRLYGTLDNGVIAVKPDEARGLTYGFLKVMSLGTYEEWSTKRNVENGEPIKAVAREFSPVKR